MAQTIVYVVVGESGPYPEDRVTWAARVFRVRKAAERYVMQAGRRARALDRWRSPDGLNWSEAKRANQRVPLSSHDPLVVVMDGGPTQYRIEAVELV